MVQEIIILILNLCVFFSLIDFRLFCGDLPSSLTVVKSIYIGAFTNLSKARSTFYFLSTSRIRTLKIGSNVFEK